MRTVGRTGWKEEENKTKGREKKLVCVDKHSRLKEQATASKHVWWQVAVVKVRGRDIVGSSKAERQVYHLRVTPHCAHK